MKKETLIFPLLNILLAAISLVFFLDGGALWIALFSVPLGVFGGVIPLLSIVAFKTDTSSLTVAQTVIYLISVILFFTVNRYIYLWAPVVLIAAGVIYGIRAKSIGKWLTAFLACPVLYTVFPFIIFVMAMSGYRG